MLRQYKPAALLEAQKKAQAAGASAEQAPLRALRLDRLQHEVQVR